MLRIGWEQVRAFRARRHHLEARVPKQEMLRVVRELCGLHAQLLSSAELTLWARVEGVRQGELAEALWRKRTLVKTWAMRGTLHLFTPGDLPLWHGALSTYDHYLRPPWLRYFGISPAQIGALTEAIGEALLGRELTREELGKAVAAKLGDATLAAKLSQSWGTILKPAAYLGKLCFARGEPPRVRFTSPVTWVGERKPLPPERALDTVVRRFLSTHGPAGQADFARWFGLRATHARLRLAKLELAELDVEGSRLFALPEDVPALRRAKPVESVRLLPAFDQFVVSASLHAERFMPRPLRPRVFRPQGWLSPVLFASGRMSGVWRAERKGKALAVAIEPFTRLPAKVRRAAGEEAERLAAFHGRTLVLTWS